jgi:hypothetical protein
VSLLGVIADLKTGDGAGAGSYAVTRHATGTLALGRYTAGATSSLTITAVVQPLSGRDLESLPEGRSASDTRVVHTATALQVNPPDVVTIGGEAYAVYHVERWELRGRVFFRCYAARQVIP